MALLFPPSTIIFSIFGDIDQEQVYAETDFNRIIEIKEREQHWVKIFMEAIDQNEKTLVIYKRE